MLQRTWWANDAFSKPASNQAVSAIECSESRHAVVAGTELEGNGPGDAPMFVW